MHPDGVAAYRCPADLSVLKVEGAVTDGGDIVAGELVSPAGRRYVIADGIADFVIPAALSPAEAKIRSEYDAVAAGAYDGALDWIFEVFHEDEERLRDETLTPLNIQPESRVLEVGCGSGRHTRRVARRLGAAGALYALDLSLPMVALCRRKLAETVSGADIKCQLNYAVANALSLPFAADFFDVVLHVGSFNEFDDPKHAAAEFTRVVRPGGMVMVSDESIAPWLRGTEFQRILSASNPLYEHGLPLDALPESARDVTARFMLGNCYYVITFRKGDGLPPLDLDLPYKGPKGGTLRSRYSEMLNRTASEAKGNDAPGGHA